MGPAKLKNVYPIHMSNSDPRRQAALARWYKKMAWYGRHPVARHRVQLERLGHFMDLYQKSQAARLAETRKLFGRPVCLVDIHTHSLHSDGMGTVAENAARVRLCGLDFFFSTDHERLTQRPAVKRLARAGWGQEPPIGGGHHLGVLSNEQFFRPRMDSMAEDFQRARRLAPFVWVPHPAGWHPDVRYPPEKIQLLWQLGPAFAMEILAGPGKPITTFDEFDRKTVLAWDRLLGDGRKVTAVSGSDAHTPFCIGWTWTGVFAPRRSAPSIIRAMNQGLCFASESALLEFSCNGKPMGSTLRARPGVRLACRFRVADAGGIASVRVISRGRIVKEVRGEDRPVVEGSLIVKASDRPAYYRLETTARDDRRAFATPVYVEPMR